MSDAYAFSTINPNSNPITITQDQAAIIQDQINQITDPSLKSAVQNAFNNAKSSGKVITK
jgi:hypothetical protein